MRKKVFILFICLLLAFPITKVEAIMVNEIIIPQVKTLEKMIKTDVNGTLEYLESKRYIDSDVLIYEIGNTSGIVNNIVVGKEQQNDKIIKIIKEANSDDALLNFSTKNTDDLYIATQIAIDCIQNNYSVDVHYYIGEDIAENLKLRAEAILDTARELVEIGNNTSLKNKKSVVVRKKGEFDDDNVKTNYCSQEYEVKIEGMELINYKVEKRSTDQTYFYIADSKTGEENTNFNAPNNTFKIMVPKENREEPFEIQIETMLNIYIDRIYLASNGTHRFIVYKKEKGKSNIQLNLYNTLSDLSVNLIDKDTKEKIAEGIIKIEDNEYIISKLNNVILYGLGKGQISVNFIKVPDNYVKPNDGYIIDIGYKDSHIENIEVEHKKGELLITSNVNEAVYDIYNSDNQYINSYKTDDKGIIHIDKINIGSYKLTQNKDILGYKKIEDISFEINYNELTNILLEHEKEEDVKKPPVEENPPRKDDIEEKPNNKPNHKEEGTLNGNIDQILTPEDKKQEQYIQENINEELKSTGEKEKTKNTNQINKGKSDNSISKLPRTGTDYFYIKLILINIFIFFIILFLKNSKHI